MSEKFTTSDLNLLVDDPRAAVALVWKQNLLPAEGEGAVIFPPTYAFKGSNTYYSIDELSDGTKIAMIDSVGAQANRIEPIFKRERVGEVENPLASLVPQITIKYETDKFTTVFDVGHRLGDAIVRSSSLSKEVHDAFVDVNDNNDYSKLAKIGPTSLIFGVWDSRDTLVKIPRVLQSTICAEDVSELRRSAQYNPAIDYASEKVFTEEERKKSEGNEKSVLAQRGYVHVPAVNTHGGVIARGAIYRTITLNLIALRRLDGKHGKLLRRYILGLSLVAATAPMDGFLRSGCLLVPDNDNSTQWQLLQRSGERIDKLLTEECALAYARQASKDFGVGEDRDVKFDKSRAVEDLKKKN